MDEQARSALEAVLGQLSDDLGVQATLRESCEGRFGSVAEYVEARLTGTLAARRRWMNFVVGGGDHAAIGEIWEELGFIVVVPCGEDGGVFVFLGKG